MPVETARQILIFNVQKQLEVLIKIHFYKIDVTWSLYMCIIWSLVRYSFLDQSVNTEQAKV
jgi:hypothetical protein